METKACGKSEFYNQQTSYSNVCLWLYIMLHLITELGNRIYFKNMLKKQIAEHSKHFKFSALEMEKTFFFFKQTFSKKLHEI